MDDTSANRGGQLLVWAGMFYLLGAGSVMAGSASQVWLIVSSVVCSIVALGFVTAWLVVTKD